MFRRFVETVRILLESLISNQWEEFSTGVASLSLALKQGNEIFCYAGRIRTARRLTVGSRAFGRFKNNRYPLLSISLISDYSQISCIENDFITVLGSEIEVFWAAATDAYDESGIVSVQLKASESVMGAN